MCPVFTPPVKLWENHLLPRAHVQWVKQPVVGPLFKKKIVSIATCLEELDFWPLFWGYSIMVFGFVAFCQMALS